MNIKKYILTGIIALAILGTSSSVCYATAATTKSLQMTGTMSSILVNYDSSFWNGWSKALGQRSVSITYNISVTKDTGAIVSDGSSVMVGDKLILSFVPHVYTDIYWTGLGYAADTPYGEWAAGAAPPAVSCLAKDFVNSSTCTAPNYSNTWDVYIPFVVSLPTETISNTSGMSCGALTGNETIGYSMACTVTGTGTLNPHFNFGSASGKFYYRRVDAGVCRGNNIALEASVGDVYDPFFECLTTSRSHTSQPYTLNLPDQTLSYTLTALSAVAPPTVSISGCGATINWSPVSGARGYAVCLTDDTTGIYPKKQTGTTYYASLPNEDVCLNSTGSGTSYTAVVYSGPNYTVYVVPYFSGGGNWGTPSNTISFSVPGANSCPLPAFPCTGSMFTGGTVCPGTNVAPMLPGYIWEFSGGNICSGVSCCSRFSTPRTNMCKYYTTTDLTAGSITPTATTTGTTIFSAAINNISNSPTFSGAGSFYNIFQKATDGDGTGAYGIGLFNQNSPIAPNSSAVASISYNFPSPGTYFLRLCVDEYDMSQFNPGYLGETDETNNCGAWTPITVTAQTYSCTGSIDGAQCPNPTSPTVPTAWSSAGVGIGTCPPGATNICMSYTIPPTCSSFTYGDWGTCSGGTQSRSVTGSSPSGCVGGSPIITQNCSDVTCKPTVNGNDSPTFANVGQLVTWTTTGATSNSTWSTTLNGPHEHTGATYPIRYSTIGNKTMYVEDVPCKLTVGGSQNLPIINNPWFEPN